MRAHTLDEPLKHQERKLSEMSYPSWFVGTPNIDHPQEERRVTSPVRLRAKSGFQSRTTPQQFAIAMIEGRAFQELTSLSNLSPEI